MRFAFFSPPLQGHLRSCSALAERLRAEGHKCFLVVESGTATIPAEFTPLVLSEEGSTLLRDARHPDFPFGLARLVADMARSTDRLCRLAPDLLRDARIDAVIGDQMEAAGALIAQHLGLPFISLANAFPINREPLMPLPVLAWPYDGTEQGRQRNQVGERIADILTASHDKVIGQWATHWGLHHIRRLSDCVSPTLDLAQGCRGFDFPRHEAPAQFRYIGRLRSVDAIEPRLELPGRIAGKPLIYVSLGTLQGHRLRLLRRIGRAARLMGAQLLISHCHGLSERDARSIGADWIFPWVPQEQALHMADVVVSHGGYNTTLDTLAAGLPMLCLPLAFEQPGIAARLQRSGAGLLLSPRSTARAMAAALERLLADPGFAEAAQLLGAELDGLGGAPRAVRLIEAAVGVKVAA